MVTITCKAYCQTHNRDPSPHAWGHNGLRPGQQLKCLVRRCEDKLSHSLYDGLMDGTGTKSKKKWTA